MSEFHLRMAEYRQMAHRIRDLAVVAHHGEIKAELLWLADSYDRLAERMQGNEALFGCESDDGAPMHSPTSKN